MMGSFKWCYIALVLFIPESSATANGSFRLWGGERSNQGIVQVKINDEWKYLCDDNRMRATAIHGGMICQQLGYNASDENGYPYQLRADYTRFGYWNTGFTCDSNDKYLLDCNNTGWDTLSWCHQFKIYKLACQGEVGFQISSSISQGTVYIYDGHYGYNNLCPNDTTTETIQVFCRQMGYLSGRSFSVRDRTGTQMKNESYICTGSESQLSECQLTDASPDCFDESGVAAGAACIGKVSLIGTVVPLSDGYGPIKVYNISVHANFLCADGFDANAAQVVCRELGHSGQSTILPSASFKSYIDSETRFEQTFTCTGTENLLSECRVSTSKACGITDKVAVVACDVPTDHTQDGKINIDGIRVQVLYHGIWGYICGTRWGHKAASVVCGDGREGSAYRMDSSYNEIKPTWIFDADCSGDETNLTSCNITYGDDTSFTCASEKYAAVTCYDDPYEYSLSGGGTDYGYLQITKNGKTGYAINLKTDSLVARSACFSLGFNGGKTTIMPAVSSKYWWDVSRDDNVLIHRLKVINDQPYYSGSDQKYLAVRCYGKVRFGGGHTSNYGYLLEFKYTRFYSFCGDGLTLKEGDAFCKELGWVRATSISSNASYYDSSPIGIYNFTCPQKAASTADCTSVFTGNGDGCKSGKASVFCTEIPEGGYGNGGDGNGMGGNNAGTNIPASIINTTLCAILLMFIKLDGKT